MRGKCRDFPVSPAPAHAQTPPLSTCPTRVVTTDEPTQTHHCHPKSRVYMRVHSWSYTFCGFWQMCNDTFTIIVSYILFSLPKPMDIHYWLGTVLGAEVKKRMEPSPVLKGSRVRVCLSSKPRLFPLHYTACPLHLLLPCVYRKLNRKKRGQGMGNEDFYLFFHLFIRVCVHSNITNLNKVV